jgi:HEAT repeat protein/nucleoside phosphorylase
MTPEFSRYLERLKKQEAAHYIAPRFRIAEQKEEITHLLGIEQLIDRVETGGPRTWFVTGPAGAGKTTLTMHAAIHLLSRSVACLRLDARSIKRLTDEHAPVDAKELILRGRPVEVDEALWKSRAKKQRLVLLIDGVNELRRLYADTPRWATILSLLAGNHPFPVVATSRQQVEELEEIDQRDVTLLSLERLSKDEVEAYVKHRGLDPAATLTQITAHKMEGATWNPFFLKLLVDHLLSGVNPEFPRSRAALLEMTIRHAMGPGKLAPEEQGLKEQGLDLHAVVCSAALVMLARRDLKALKRDVVELLERVWGESTAVHHIAEAFLETHMVERLESTGSFEFLHEALIDFGLSLGFRDSPPPAFAFNPEITDQFLGNWVGLARDPDAAAQFLLQRVHEERRPDLLFDVILANRGILAEATQEALWTAAGEGLTTHTGRPIRDASARHLAAFPHEIRLEGIKYQVHGALRVDEPEVAEQVHHALLRGTMSAEWLQRVRRELSRTWKQERSGPAEFRAESAQAPIHPDNLSDADLVAEEEPSESATRGSDTPAGALGQLGDRMAVPDLLKVLREAPDPKTRGTAATTLGKLGDRRAVPRLLETLLNDPDSGSRGPAATALGQLGDRFAVPVLCQTLLEDANPRVRGSAATALGQLGDRSATAALSQTLLKDADPIVRGSAATALGQLADRSTLTALSQAFLQDAEPRVRGAVATALGQLADSSTVSVLSQALLQDAEPRVRGAAATALGLFADRSAVTALSQALLQDAEPSVRGSAATALGQFGDRPSVTILSQALLEDMHSKVRGSAATALGLLGDRAAVDALIQMLTGDEDPKNRGAAATALGKLGDRKAVPKLIETLLKEPMPVGRGSAATALGQIGDRSAVTALSEALLKDTDSKVRGSAATALGLLGDRAAVDALIQMLTGDEDPKNRGAAATALGKLGDRKAVPKLIKTLLEDPDPSGRWSAATALGQIGDRSAIPFLGQALNDPHTGVRSSASYAAGLLQAKELSDALRLRLFDPRESSRARLTAARSLIQISANAVSVLRQAADAARWDSSASARHETKWLSGLIVALVAKHAKQDEDFEWLERTARQNPNPINRIEALRHLSIYGRATDELILFLIAPVTPRPDGRKNDTDYGVLGEACAAVLRRYAAGNSPSERLLNAAVAILTSPGCRKQTISTALSILRTLPLADAARALNDLTARAQPTHSSGFLFFGHLDQHHRALERRKRVHQELLDLGKSPEAILKRFRPLPFFAPEARMSQDRETDVAVITAINEETASVLGEFRALGITVREQVISERYYYVAEVPKRGDSGKAVRVVLSQGTQKGALSAQSLTSSLLPHFQPRWILLAGICGGLDERNVSIGDLIVANHVFHYEPEKQMDGASGLRPAPYTCDPFILRAVQHLEVTGKLSGILGTNRILPKAYASGDKVLASRGSETRQKLLGISYDVAGFEMEAPGMLHAIAEAFKGPQYFAGGVIKAVCDLGDENMDASKKNGNRALALERFAKFLTVLLPELDKDTVAGLTAT